MDVFDLVAKIRLDSSEYEQGVGNAKGTFSKLASGVKNGLATVAKVGTAAVAAGVAGVTALTKMGVEGYAQYEQLVGGVETLFKESQNIVMGYAENAYKTAGMSANQYMNTVTSFSASLIQSLDGDTAKAAKVADMAITDMSDNANKMGTEISMIQNAYNGFAKGNFTMLDNLKLGYGGTKDEMQRLLDKAGEISGIKYDISSFADISEAIHVIQQDLEISGISYEEAMQRVANGEMTMEEAMAAMGTTAKEAATTIEGSLSMMKGAWENLVVGMADENANMEVLINNFVESTATAAQNLLPRIEQTLKGIGDLITALAPVIAEALPVLVEAVLPSLLTAGVSLVTAIVNGVVTALPALYTALLEAVQIILVEVFGVSEEKAGEFADSINSFFDDIKNGFAKLVKSANTEGTVLNDIWKRLQQAFQLVKTALETAFKAVSKAFSWCVEQVNTDGTWLNEIWNGIVGTVKAFQGYLSASFDFVSNAFKWFVEQISTEGTELNTIFQVVSAFATGTFENIKTVISTAIGICQNVIKAFTAVLRGDWSEAWNSVENAAQGGVDAVGKIFETCKTTVKNAVKALKDALDFKWELPKLKLPHITVSGGKAPYGIGGKGSLPSFDIQWYKKAYDRAMILSHPTIFGYSSGKFLGGGDGNGNEIVAGESYLMGLISNAVERKNDRIVSLLAALLEATVDGNLETIRALSADRTFAVGEREFARLVKQYA